MRKLCTPNVCSPERYHVTRLELTHDAAEIVIHASKALLLLRQRASPKNGLQVHPAALRGQWSGGACVTHAHCACLVSRTGAHTAALPVEDHKQASGLPVPACFCAHSRCNCFRPTCMACIPP
jgi:hypothetical protein